MEIRRLARKYLYLYRPQQHSEMPHLLLNEPLPFYGIE